MRKKGGRLHVVAYEHAIWCTRVCARVHVCVVNEIKHSFNNTYIRYTSNCMNVCHVGLGFFGSTVGISFCENLHLYLTLVQYR